MKKLNPNKKKKKSRILLNKTEFFMRLLCLSPGLEWSG